MVSLLFWAVIITVWEAARILSSSVEYLSAHLYVSSIVASGSSDSDWKKGVVGPKFFKSSGGPHPCYMHRFVGQPIQISR